MKNSNLHFAPDASGSTVITTTKVYESAKDAAKAVSDMVASNPENFITFGFPPELGEHEKIVLSNVSFTIKQVPSKKEAGKFYAKVTISGSIGESNSKIARFAENATLSMDFDKDLYCKASEKAPAKIKNLTIENTGNVERGMNPLTNKPYIFPTYELTFA